MINRRKFLRDTSVLGGAALTPGVLAAVAQAIVNSFVREAAAEEILGPGDPRYYISYEMFGAPPRYCFDQWMRTSAAELPLIRNEFTDTKLTFSGGVLAGSEPGTFLYKNILVPHLFSTNVQMAGQARPLTNLLDNMLVVRGYATGIDGHTNNATRHIIPVGGKPSLTGAVADESKSYFGAVGWPSRGTAGVYESRTGRALNTIAGIDPLNKLLEGFTAPPLELNARNLKEAQKSIFEKYQALLKTYSRSERPGSKIVGQNLKAATDLLQTGQFGDLAAYWAPAVQRYSDTIYQNMRSTNFPGIFDGALVNQAAFENRLRVQTEGELIIPATGFDMRQVMKNVVVPAMAEAFALAEYCVTRGIAHGIELVSTGWQDLFLQKTGETTPRGGFVSGFDIHETGSYAALVISSCYFRGLAAAILELSDRLKQVNDSKGRNLWSQTVFHVFGEFTRMPRFDASGSDHGFYAMASSVFSGAITRPMVVGNVFQGGLNVSYPGSQGLGAPIVGYNQTDVPTPAMLNSTLTEILRISKNPYSNLAAPLVRMVDDKVEYASFGPGKLIVGGQV